MAFQQGLSGLNAAARHLDTIGHNVANASTVGFKASRAEFADVYATTVYGVSNVSPGIGTEVGAIAQQFSQGALTTTNNSLDLGINGGGFFRMSDNGGAITYTREGQFKLDKSGYIVNASGKRLTGYPVDKNGVVTNGTAQDLKLDSTDIAPKQTTSAAVRVNVDARATTPANAFTLTDAKTYDGGTSVSVFDSLGREHVMAMYFRKTGDNSWDVHGTLDGEPLNGGAAVGKLAFNPNGTLKGASDGNGDPTTSNVMTFDVSLNMGADAGGNQWGETADSGAPLVGSPSTGTLGVIQSGALESSNVDLTQELVNMITAQRVYQANAQTVRTHDQLLQTIVNLR